jgi:hypothetical protein
VSVLALTAFALLEESAAARDYLHCVSKKVVIVDAPKGTTSSSTEENLGFWIDEATKIVTLADGKKLNVRGGPALRDSSAAWLRWILGSITPPISPRLPA